MSWHANLSVEIASMFADFSVREDEVQAVLEMRAACQAAYRADPSRRKLAVERTRQWRKDNPEQWREMNRRSNRRYRERAKSDPAVRAKLSASNRARIRRKWEKNPEQVRAWWRESQRALRDRKRIAAGLPPTNGRGRPRIPDLDEARAELQRRIAARRAA